MKILMVTAGYLPDAIGGVELHLQGLCRVLRNEHEVQIFRRFAQPETAEFELLESEVDGVRVSGVNYLFGDADEFMKLVENPRITETFVQVFEQMKPDLVHIHHLTCLSTTIVDACVEHGVPVVLSLHDFWLGCPRGQRITSCLSPCETIEAGRCTRCYAETWPPFFPKSDEDPEDPQEKARTEVFDRYHHRIREVLEHASALITPSPFSARLFREYGADSTKMRVIPYGLEKSRFRRNREDRDGARAIGFLGNLLPSKGVHVLIEAFRRLLQDAALEPSLRESLRLEIHGARTPYHNDDWYDRRLERMARPHSEQIRFHDRYENDEVPKLLERLDILVVPSIWFETWGIVVREAFLAQVPVVTTDFGALGESVIDGKTGLLFRRGDAEHLYEQLKPLVLEPSLSGRLTSAPKELLSVEENAEAVMKAYREVVGER